MLSLYYTKNSHFRDCQPYFILIIALEIVLASDSINWCELLIKRDAPIPIAAATSHIFCKTLLFMNNPAPYISYYTRSPSLWDDCGYN